MNFQIENSIRVEAKADNLGWGVLEKGKSRFPRAGPVLEKENLVSSHPKCCFYRVAEKKEEQSCGIISTNYLSQ
jgi:hypothetical protein